MKGAGTYPDNRRAGFLLKKMINGELIVDNFAGGGGASTGMELAPKTMERIARGLKKFVLDNPEPFIVPIGYGERKGQAPRVHDIEKPLPTIVGSGKHYLCEPYMVQIGQTGFTSDRSKDVRDPLAGDGHFGEVRAFLIKYYGQGTGQDIKAPLDTVTAQDRFGLVTINGVDYQIVDIGLRMLEPRELYGCQGFPEDYIIDHDYTGKTYPRSEQVRRCGNAVCPPIPAALVRANLPELRRYERRKNMRIEKEQTGQLRFA